MTTKSSPSNSYWSLFWKQWSQSFIGMVSLAVTALFCLVAIYAPFLASSKPLVVKYAGEWYFPLFRYLFYQGFFTKWLDIFYNLLIFTFPLFVVSWFLFRNWKVLLGIAGLQVGLFIMLIYFPLSDPASDPALNRQRQQALMSDPTSELDWNKQLTLMTPYEKLNRVLLYKQQKAHHENIMAYLRAHQYPIQEPSTIWQLEQNRQREELATGNPAKIKYIEQKNQWLQEQAKQIKYDVMPLIRPFHWEDDAGGDQRLNRYVSWWNLTRINKKDMVASLIFGVRISLCVGITAVALALIIGVPIGALAGYYGGRVDIITYRLIEIWESMPTFFMLLMVVAFLQTKSIFLVIGVLGLFGWTSFSRYVRGEFFKQKQLPYTEACHALGFRDGYTIFYHLLPNAIPPLLTLVPFAIMGAITSEAGLSFLGLGEEGSCSWGVLMDEGRTAFPSESYLLWPPAILLTILLIAIALVGDTLRDALDPKLRTSV